jgi:hypothetical protein
LGALGFLAFGFDAPFLADDDRWVFAFFSFAGVAGLAGEAAGWAGVSTFGASATGVALVFGAFVVLAFGALGLLADFPLDLLAFCD